MIIHDRITLISPDAPVVFAELMGVSCSICAPEAMTAQEVERFANEQGPNAQLGKWVTIDKGAIGFGTPTPNPCNQVAGRRHWFLLDEINAARLAGEYRR